MGRQMTVRLSTTVIFGDLDGVATSLETLEIRPAILHGDMLASNSNLCPILHRFWDTAIYRLKIAYFSYPFLIRRPRSLCSLWNFAPKLTMRKLLESSWGYPPVKTA